MVNSEIAAKMHVQPGQGIDGGTERSVKRDRRIIVTISTEVGVPVHGPGAIRAAQEGTRAVFIERNGWACLRRCPPAAEREQREQYSDKPPRHRDSEEAGPWLFSVSP